MDPHSPASPDAALEASYARLGATTGAGGGWVIGQLGQSLDGYIATHNGDSCYVTGPESLVHLHRLRALCDVVLVGAGTVAADNPRLTVRHVPGRNPARAVLDPSARLDGRSNLFHDGQSPTLWICDARFAPQAVERLSEAQAADATEVLPVEALVEDGGWCPARVLKALSLRGHQRVFVEGGGVTVSRFMEAGCLDRLHLVVAPVLIGHGRRGLQLAAWPRMADCPRIPAVACPLGGDILWDLDLQAAAPRIGPR